MKKVAKVLVRVEVKVGDQDPDEALVDLMVSVCNRLRGLGREQVVGSDIQLLEEYETSEAMNAKLESRAQVEALIRARSEKVVDLASALGRDFECVKDHSWFRSRVRDMLESELNFDVTTQEDPFLGCPRIGVNCSLCGSPETYTTPSGNVCRECGYNGPDL
jgi:hypothetical protein